MRPNFLYRADSNLLHSQTQPVEKKRNDYAFRRRFNEKPSIIPAAQVMQPVLKH